jgi:hypothetical protein
MATEIHLGFSGTRYGMTTKQKQVFGDYIAIVDPVTFHEGSCIGSDYEAVIMAYRYRSSKNKDLKLIAHPPIDTKLKADFSQYDEIREPLRHFARNRAIVHETGILVATPYDSPMTLMEIKGSLGGTWHTVNYAIKRGRVTHIIMPSGIILDSLARQITLEDIKITVANFKEVES